MESFLKADIFFFITSICVVVITLVLLIAGIYFIRMIRNFYKISKVLRNCAENAGEGLQDLGHQIRQSPLFTFIFGKEKEKKYSDNHSKKTI